MTIRLPMNRSVLWWIIIIIIIIVDTARRSIERTGDKAIQKLWTLWLQSLTFRISINHRVQCPAEQNNIYHQDRRHTTGDGRAGDDSWWWGWWEKSGSACRQRQKQ